MRLIALTLLAGLTAGCASTTAYWSRPGSNLPQLASESEACYREAIGEESPSALTASQPASAIRLLPRSDPPPALWKRAPRQAGFERFDEQLRYERCMRAHGWVPVGSAMIHR